MRKIYLISGTLFLLTCLFIVFINWNSFFPPLSSKGANAFVHEEKESSPREILEQEILMTRDPRLGIVPSERLLQYEEFKSRLARSMGKVASGNGWQKPGSGGQNGPQAGSGQGGSEKWYPDGFGQQAGGGNEGAGQGAPGGQPLSGGGLGWNERGPDNIGGRCRAILIDKSDLTGNTVLVGSVSGGLWRTTNFTSATPTWTLNGTVLANLAITTLAQDPANPNILYAGTGEGYFNLDAVRGLGIYKSTDNGLNWALLPSTTKGGANQNDFNFVQKLAVYSNGDLYAAGISANNCNAGGILRSKDKGATWTRVIGTFGGAGCNTAVDFNGYDIAFSTGGDIYATVIDQSTGTPDGKIYRSPAGTTVGNAGTWVNITPSPGVGSFWQRIQVACSPTNNSRVYALMQGTGNSVGGIRRTDNAGTSWTNINSTTTWCDGGSPGGSDFSRGQAWYDLTLTINPSNDAIVYAGGVDIMKTTNSGGAWAQITQWASGCAVLPYVHADIHNIIFLPGSSTAFIVCCDGGIFYTTDGGASFVSKNQGLNITQYYAANIHPTSGSNYMLAGSQDNGSHIFQNPGINAVTTASGGDGIYCFIDQKNPMDQITSFTNANYVSSTDGGASFPNSFSSNDGRFVNPAAFDDSLKKLYCGSVAGKLKRISSIFTVSPTSTDISISSNPDLQVSAVKVDPDSADNVWVAMSVSDNATGNPVPLLYLVKKASTGGPVIAQMGAATLTLPAGSYISSIDVERADPKHLVLAASNYGIPSVWESKDRGATWASLDNNGVNLPDMPVYWAMIVPSTGNVNTGGANGGILLATEMGVWSTTTTAGTGTVWVENSTPMGNVSTRELLYRPADLQVVAATHGRGLFTSSIAATPLPLTFISFTGNTAGNDNHLDWKVVNEYNNKGFVVERSYRDNAGFVRIGFVPASSSSFQTSDVYFFDDPLVDLGKGVASYRLRQVDLDGKETFSSIIVLQRPASGKIVEYISASGNNLFIRMNNSNGSSTIRLQILDISGRVLSNREIVLQSQTLDIGSLARGAYVLRLTDRDGRQYSGRFEKQ